MPEAMTPSRTSSSSTLLPVARDTDTASIRPRNRRLLSAQDDAASSSAVSSPSRSPSRGASPIPPPHIGSVTGRNNSRTEVVRSASRTQSPSARRGLLDGSWAPSWSSVQELASSLLSTGGLGTDSESQRANNKNRSGSRKPIRQASFRNERGNGDWGPEPPNEARPRPDDIAAGSRAKREAALKTLRTASVLEGHEGFSGGVDVARKFKKRSSDDDLRDTAQSQETEEYLAYIHNVQATDTYAGIVLKYRCREDAFRKANGLWSRENIQVRKWLAIPVDACEVKGRPCDPPTNPSSKVDLLSKTPEATDPFGRDIQGNDDFFSAAANGHAADQSHHDDADRPWTHVRWVSIDSHPHPVEVARVPRKALGYFPPRRKKSMHTMSSLSTPRASADLPALAASESAVESPRSSSSRRPSLLSARGGSAFSASSSRLGSAGSAGDDPRPAWMRRPGGVGSLGRHVRAPGPERDSLNAWARKHLPVLNMDALPSMSVMGSETARFGFTRPDEDDPQAAAAIAESPFEEGRDTTAASRQGTGLDKAAAAVETWLRGAFERAKQGPLTPVLGPRGRPGGSGGGSGGRIPDLGGDLIELEDTTSDDGRHESARQDHSAPRSSPRGGVASARSPGQWAAGARGRGGAEGGQLGRGGNKKAD